MNFTFETKTRSTASEKKSIWTSAFTPFFNNQKKEAFYTELGLLLKAKIPVKESIQIICAAATKKKDQQFYGPLIVQLANGAYFYQSMQQLNNCSIYEWNAIKIGEETGQLERVILSLANYYKQKNSFRRTLTSALAYPTLLMITAFIVIVFMLTTIVPLFKGIFQQQGVKIPWITQQIIDLASGIQNYGLLILLGLIVLLFLSRILYQKPRVKEGVQSFLFGLPIIGNQLRMNYSFQFSQSMHLLTQSHVDLAQCLRLLQEMYTFYPLQKALKQISHALETGEGFGHSLKEALFFDARMHSFIRVGEETNQLETIFGELTSYYGEKINQRSKRLSSLLEPIIIVFVGSVIAVILVAMYLPMFQLSTTIG